MKTFAFWALILIGPWGWAILVLYFIGAAIQKQNSHTKPEELPGVPQGFPQTDSDIGENLDSRPADSNARTLLIAEICARFSGQDYYVSEMIPNVKLVNATKMYPVPGGGRVIALIDTTVKGSAVNGMAIGEKGISWHNSWETKTRQTSLEWNELSKVTIESDQYDIKLGDGNNFGTAGSVFGKDNVIALLRQLQQIERTETSTSPPVSKPPMKAQGLDVNSASFEELIALSGIGAAEAQLLLKNRDLGVYPSSIDELSNLLDIKPHVAKRLEGRVIFSNPERLIPFTPPHSPEQPQNAPNPSPPHAGGGRRID